jgi:hypothetical protein
MALNLEEMTTEEKLKAMESRGMKFVEAPPISVHLLGMKMS